MGHRVGSFVHSAVCPSVCPFAICLLWGAGYCRVTILPFYIHLWVFSLFSIVYSFLSLFYFPFLLFSSFFTRAPSSRSFSSPPTFLPPPPPPFFSSSSSLHPPLPPPVPAPSNLLIQQFDYIFCLPSHKRLIPWKLPLIVSPRVVLCRLFLSLSCSPDSEPSSLYCHTVNLSPSIANAHSRRNGITSIIYFFRFYGYNLLFSHTDVKTHNRPIPVSVHPNLGLIIPLSLSCVQKKINCCKYWILSLSLCLTLRSRVNIRTAVYGYWFFFFPKTHVIIISENEFRQKYSLECLRLSRFVHYIVIIYANWYL